ncbi:MAG: hypothetical protein JSV88_30580 [Candidatus Aminicenantes bacterium]|nr:MAG: hypothetical protein JSV88_30580 [Candidatus Aminicenantes bacterium]
MRVESLKKSFLVTCVTCLFILTSLFACTCSSPLLADTEDVMTRSFNVSKGGTLTIDVNRASIEVKTGSQDIVKVKVIRKVGTSNEHRAQEIFEKYKIEFDHSGSNVTIETDDYGRRKGLFSWLKGEHFSVRFIVTVPEKYNLDLETSGGSIRVSDIQGNVRAKTSGGSLKFDYIKGPVWGSTSGGSIQLEGCSGNANVYTSGGSIRIGTVEGEVKAKTSGGSIQVKEVMGTINASTSGGSVSATISKQPKGDCSLTTSGGSITVYVTEDIKVDLNASTSGGRVSTDFPITIQGEISKRKLKGKINGGGPELYLKTSGGSIYIKKM